MEDKPQKQCVIPIHKPSLRELIFFFLCGILVSVPNALVFEQFSSFLPYALTVIIVAPFVEEFAKVLPLFYRHGETERSIVTLGILIGLGFGITEFFLYVLVYDVPWFVRIPGIIFHASSACVTAYGIAKKKPLAYYLTSVLLHGANNFFAVVTPGSFGVLAELLILVAVYLLAWRFYHQASDEKMVV
jgi:RsiW-degrading membrane proteinase PrsW (M82 family)